MTERSISPILVVIGQVNIPINTQAVGDHHVVWFVSSQGKPAYYPEGDEQINSGCNQENHSGNGSAIHVYMYL